MSKEAALERYTRARKAIEAHIKANKDLFEAHEKLVFEQIRAESALRDEVATSGVGISNIDFKVSCDPVTQEVWDEQATLTALRVSREGAIAAGLLKVNQRPPRITISSTL